MEGGWPGATYGGHAFYYQDIATPSASKRCGDYKLYLGLEEFNAFYGTPAFNIFHLPYNDLYRCNIV
jgi:hypothetical protein